MSKKSLKNWKGVIAVVGIDWGDSGKGRLVDDLSQNTHIVARYNGGSNTGHTVDNAFGKFALHMMPSGIFNKKAICLIGKNVAVDLESLADEMEELKKAGVSYQNLVIDYRASLTMPWHKKRDGLRESLRGNKKVGTTGKGVGPTYADRTERVGLLVGDLIAKDFKQKFYDELKIQNKLFKLNLNADKIFNEYQSYKNKIRTFIGDTVDILEKAMNSKKNILFEGAQGYFLDIDSGTYPFVTSSNPGVIGIQRSFGIATDKIHNVIGITKAYTTRVGQGPMPTKIKGKEAKHIIEVGREVGTTTGRIREPGWLDIVLINEAKKTNNLTSLAITKLDVLSKLTSVKICVGYKKDGKQVKYKPHDAYFLENIMPVYLEMPGWSEDISNCRKKHDLPLNAQKYIKKIEEYTNVPVDFIGVGPKRGEVIYE